MESKASTVIIAVLALAVKCKAQNSTTKCLSYFSAYACMWRVCVYFINDDEKNLNPAKVLLDKVDSYSEKKKERKKSCSTFSFALLIITSQLLRNLHILEKTGKYTVACFSMVDPLEIIANYFSMLRNKIYVY